MRAFFVAGFGMIGLFLTALSPSEASPNVADASGPRVSVTDLRATAAHATRPTSNYSVLHSFVGADGSAPQAALIDINGTLYGTTYRGGATGLGTVYAITPSGTETVLYSFKGGANDGRNPVAPLVNVNGTLFGTTPRGGDSVCQSGCGTVFSITTSGAEHVIHDFGASGDGYEPFSGLVNVNGTLYGTTSFGGATSGAGTVFAITPSGAETVIYNFGASGDGYYSIAGLIDVNGSLYGTTQFGGANRRCISHCGTAFAVTTSGTETVLHNFGAAGDGHYPGAALVDVNGTLYGTTEQGGANGFGFGTVFAITPSGTETVVHSFGAKGDGKFVFAGLVADTNGTLYGVTSGGGSLNAGTLFSIAPSGKETVLHSFGGTGDGANPVGGLIEVNGTLYGTTLKGGANGAGTVFSLTP